MKSTSLVRLLFVAAFYLYVAGALAQQPFQLSSKFYEAQFSGLNIWNGEHRFNDVFCLKFPRSGEAEAFAEAMYNNDRLYFSRAAYNNQTALYVVSSTVPSGRPTEVEISNLEAGHKKLASIYPANVTHGLQDGVLGRSLRLVVRNVIEGTKESPFPFVRPLSSPPDGRLASASVHRLYVRNSNRIEIAGLRYFKEPLDSTLEAGAIAQLSEFVDEAASSLERCTSALPQR